MDAAQYWMLMKKREIFVKRSQYYLKMKSSKSSDIHSSWEEKAFAEDSVARGCIWPPRCYSCSFCNREFNSAQALGGHMNVHRRDRARLKHHQQHSNNNDPESTRASTLVSPQQCKKLSSFVSSSQKLPQAAEKILCENNDDVETKLSIGLRFVRPRSMSCGGDEVMISCERAKTAEDNLPDLELRLGNYLPTTHVKLEALLKF